jgi:tetratricopeptide (TPR) repeat protein
VGIWHYARGRAFASLKRTSEARAELKPLQAAQESCRGSQLLLNANPAARVLELAGNVLMGEIAASSGARDEALTHLERAVRLEDALMYTEPQDWPFPARESLGAVLLDAGRAEEAETVYWADQRKNPGNPWTLFGLMISQQRQGKTEQASETERRLRAAWKNADVTLTGSKF